jgi:hypothetical protein
MGPNMSVIFVCYNREFVITVIIITEFDCMLSYEMKTRENQNEGMETRSGTQGDLTESGGSSGNKKASQLMQQKYGTKHQRG